MNIKQRMLNFIEYNGLDIKRFELNVGLSNGFVSHIGDSIRKKSLDKISERYPELNLNWLLTGIGDMIQHVNSVHDPQGEYRTTHRSKQKQKGIPVYDNSIEDEPAYEVDIPQFRDCNFGKIIHESAMLPAIHNGATIFCKLVTDKLMIIPGDMYFIKFDNYEKVRRLQRTDDSSMMLATADNMETDADGFRRYESFKIPIEKIKELYQVKGLLKVNLN